MASQQKTISQLKTELQSKTKIISELTNAQKVLKSKILGKYHINSTSISPSPVIEQEYQEYMRSKTEARERRERVCEEYLKLIRLEREETERAQSAFTQEARDTEALLATIGYVPEIDWNRIKQQEESERQDREEAEQVTSECELNEYRMRGERQSYLERQADLERQAELKRELKRQGDLEWEQGEEERKRLFDEARVERERNHQERERNRQEREQERHNFTSESLSKKFPRSSPPASVIPVIEPTTPSNVEYEEYAKRNPKPNIDIPQSKLDNNDPNIDNERASLAFIIAGVFCLCSCSIVAIGDSERVLFTTAKCLFVVGVVLVIVGFIWSIGAARVFVSRYKKQIVGIVVVAVAVWALLTYWKYIALTLVLVLFCCPVLPCLIAGGVSDARAERRYKKTDYLANPKYSSSMPEQRAPQKMSHEDEVLHGYTH